MKRKPRSGEKNEKIIAITPTNLVPKRNKFTVVCSRSLNYFKLR